MTRSYIRSVAMLSGLMAACMSAAEPGAAAAKSKRPPAEPVVIDEYVAVDPAPGANAHGIGPDVGEEVNPDTASTIDPVSLQIVARRDDTVRLVAAVRDLGFDVQEGEIDHDGLVDFVVLQLSLSKGYQSSLEASASIIDNFQTQIERLGNHILTVAPDAVEGSAVDTAIKLIGDGLNTAQALELVTGERDGLKQQVEDLQLSLETAQARARRELEEATAEVVDQAEPLELRRYQGRRRLVPRSAPG